MRGATGTLIAYATAPGKVAYDGVGNNSPFSAALAEWIDEPGLEIGLMFRRVRQEVVEATNKKSGALGRGGDSWRFLFRRR